MWSGDSLRFWWKRPFSLKPKCRETWADMEMIEQSKPGLQRFKEVCGLNGKVGGKVVTSLVHPWPQQKVQWNKQPAGTQSGELYKVVKIKSYK